MKGSFSHLDLQNQKLEERQGIYKLIPEMQLNLKQFQLLLCLCFQMSFCSGTPTPQNSCLKRYCKLHTLQTGWENNLLLILWEVKSYPVLAQIQQLWTTRVRGVRQGWGSPVSPLGFLGNEKQVFPGCTKHHQI